jgi:enoyl-CoA hydratase/carnithine racemase
MRGALEPLAGLPMPVIAAIDGDCFGAGVALALAADLRIAGPRAVFAVTPAKLGITYPQEDVARLVALVRPGQAARLLYGAARIDAAEAARIGLVEILADDAAGQAHDPALDALFDAGFAGGDFREGLDAFRARRAPRFGDRR